MFTYVKLVNVLIILVYLILNSDMIIKLVKFWVKILLSDLSKRDVIWHLVTSNQAGLLAKISRDQVSDDTHFVLSWNLKPDIQLKFYNIF